MSVNVPFHPEHASMARQLVQDMEKNGGLAPLDIGQFWHDQDACILNPFGADIVQVPFGGILNHECVYDELGVAVDFWRYDHDEDWRLELNRRYNDVAETIVGRRLLSEQRQDPSLAYPPVKGLHDVFESESIWRDESWWLKPSADTPQELEALLDRVEARDIRSFILPENWEQEKARLMALGVKPRLYRGQRGPVTFGTSIYGSENLIFLIIENPDLASRFSQVILKTMLEIGRVLDEEAGYTPETAPHGFAFFDDNCTLMTPDMYQLFGYPVLKGIFDRYCPDKEDRRYQHSDSAMGHLLPQLGELGVNETNFGPTVMVSDIREHLPHAVIYGELAPFTYCRNEHENIVLECLRDVEMAREKRGLVFGTAGSINNGTRLTSMRLAMAAIQRFGRFD